ncbi:hypothetical protein ACFE04_003378 [Oxalis oulophora]
MRQEGGGDDYTWQWHSLGAPSPSSLLMNNVHRSSSSSSNREGGDNDSSFTHFDYNSVNAVSFGFVATAILISMFLIMAIFEKFLRPNSEGNNGSNSHIGGTASGGADLEAQIGFNPKLAHSPHKMKVYANGISVLMPGDKVPTFIGRPSPLDTTKHVTLAIFSARHNYDFNLGMKQIIAAASWEGELCHILNGYKH